MKGQLCVLTLCLCAATVFGKFDVSEFTDDMNALLKKIHGVCVKETGVDESLIEDAKQGKIPDNPKLNCYTKCIMVQSGMLHEHGEIDYDGLSKVAPPHLKDDLKATFMRCSDEAGHITEFCEKAHTMAQCVRDTDPADFYFF